MPRRERRDSRTALLVAVGTAAGLAVGILVGGATAPTPPVPAASVEPSAEAPTPAASCVRAAELAQEVVDLAQEASAAMAELDARRLERLVDQMQDRDAELREQTARCRFYESTADAGPSVGATVGGDR